jgi:hypothetical protein
MDGCLAATVCLRVEGGRAGDIVFPDLPLPFKLLRQLGHSFALFHKYTCFQKYFVPGS